MFARALRIMLKRKRAGSALVALTMAVLAVVGTGPAKAGLAASPATGSGWRAIATISVPSHSTAMFAVASAAAIPGWTWAVGGTVPAAGTGQTRPIVETWTGSKWSRLAVPSAAVSALGRDPVLVTAAAFRVHHLWAFTRSGGWLSSFGPLFQAGRFRSTRPLLIQASVADSNGGAWAFGGLKTASGFVPYATFSGVTDHWKRAPVPGKGVIVSA